MLLSPEMQEVMKAKWVREVVALNREDALEEGIKKGRREGIKKGKKALTKELLHHQLVRHLRRELTPAEQRALSARAETLTGPEVADILLSERDTRRVLELLENPPPPAPKLVAAAKRRRS